MALTEERKNYLRGRYHDNIESERTRQREWQKKWRAENPEKAREIDRIKRERRREKYKSYAREYAKKHKKDPIKVAARTILNNAIRLGKVTRPVKCDKCGEDKKVQAHHKDYNFPLTVDWVCSDCHAKIHYPIKALDDIKAELTILEEKERWTEKIA